MTRVLSSVLAICYGFAVFVTVVALAVGIGCQHLHGTGEGGVVCMAVMVASAEGIVLAGGLSLYRSADKRRPQSMDSTPSLRCPVCRVENAGSRTLCVFCGSQLNQTTGDPPQSAQNPPH